MAQVTHSQKGLFIATTPKLLTYEEWLKLPEAEGIEEVVNGEIRKMPPNKWNQARVVEQLALLLRAQAIRRGSLWSPLFLALSSGRSRLTTRVPDLAVFYANRIVEQDGYIHSAPELIVEVLSPANARGAN